MITLTSAQLDRAAGTLLGCAAGDALGVPYEFGSRRLPPTGRPLMLGGGLGNYAPGQWSDDTEMTSIIAMVAATGADLRTREALDAIAAGFVRWYADGPADIGIQTRSILSAHPTDSVAMTHRANEMHRNTGRSGGNGSLMRTSPIALAHLGDRDAIATAARAVSELTHTDPAAGDCCVLWCLAIDHAVRTGVLDLRVGLDKVGAVWPDLIQEAERRAPGDFSGNNGWCVAALQHAWSAVTRCHDYQRGVETAIHGGGDTDTVAAIAGALLGARYGAEGIPAEWRAAVHGIPGLTGQDLRALALDTVSAGAGVRR